MVFCSILSCVDSLSLAFKTELRGPRHYPRSPGRCLHRENVIFSLKSYGGTAKRLNGAMKGDMLDKPGNNRSDCGMTGIPPELGFLRIRCASAGYHFWKLKYHE